MQQVLGQGTKDCEKIEICIPQKLTLTGLTSILLLPNSALPESILLAATHTIYSMVTMTQQMKEESENPGKPCDDDGIIDDDSEEMDWRKMQILMGCMIMRMLKARRTMPIWMH